MAIQLGAFSISLAVKDLERSKAFYQKLGFDVIMGEAKQKWLILRNGDAVIGLFQGMFERNLMTFNPGWTSREGVEHPEEFEDIRAIQKKLVESGIELSMKADEATSGPASVMLTDPDGNQILLDQHR
jgi:lactoylglutathione lyase